MHGEISSILSALGNLWVNGVAVDWEGFHAQERLRRIPLPAYPFQRKKFWIGPKIGSNWLADSLRKVDDWFYRCVWKAAPLPATAPSAGPLPGARRFVARMPKAGRRTSPAKCGRHLRDHRDNFLSPSEDSYVLNLASKKTTPFSSITCRGGGKCPGTSSISGAWTRALPTRSAVFTACST